MIRCAIALSLTLLVSGCIVGPDYKRLLFLFPNNGVKRPKTSPLDRPFRRNLINGGKPSMTRYSTGSSPMPSQPIWILKQALVRVKDARAQRWVTITAGLPSISGRSNVNRRLKQYLHNISNRRHIFCRWRFWNRQSAYQYFQVGFDAQWELDFFGGIRRAIEAADATVDSEIENSRAVLITLLGEVASNYITLRANQQLIAITRENLKSQQETVRLTQIRQQAGFRKHARSGAGTVPSRRNRSVFAGL